MNMIRPVSDLRNNFAEISKTVHETAQPVFLTKNGYGDMVVLSMEAFENLQFESEIYFKLQAAEREAELSSERYSSKDVLKAMKDAIGGSKVVYRRVSAFCRSGHGRDRPVYCTGAEQSSSGRAHCGTIGRGRRKSAGFSVCAASLYAAAPVKARVSKAAR